MSTKFSTGQVVATPGCLEALAASNQTASVFLDRHVQGDWGDSTMKIGSSTTRRSRKGPASFQRITRRRA